MLGARGGTALLFGALVAAVLGSAGTARGEGPPDEAAAQALFDDAKSLMKSGDYASACPKFEESERLQPAGGTLLFLGLCREGEGKTATAWAKLNDALSAARRDNRPDREQVAQEHIAALTPRLTRLRIDVSEGAKAADGLEIRRDGEVVPVAIVGLALPVDPGSHAIRATAPGMKAWETSAATGGEGATATVTIPALEREAGSVTRPAAAPILPVAPLPATPADAGSERGRTQRIVAIVLGAGGLAALGVGTGFGIAALSKKGDESAQCPGGSSGPCSPTGVSLGHDAVTDGNFSSVFLGVGAAAVLGAGVLWLTAPKAVVTTAWRVAPLVARDEAGVAVGGSW